MNSTRKILILLVLALTWAVLPGCSDDDPTGPSTPTGPAILVLGDGGTEEHVISTLKAAGMSVKDGGKFHAFTGEGLDWADAVVLLAGVEYNNDMKESGQAALVAFVGGGGGLLHTEWLNYSISRTNYHQTLKNILPTTYGGSYASGSETYGSVTTHTITKNLPSTIETGEDSQYSVLAPRSGATQLVRGSRSGAAVVAWTKGGRVVSWNMGGQYGGPNVWNTGMDQLLVNATKYVGGWGE